MAPPATINPREKGTSGRWTILAVLFVVRATMAFQFQSVAAVAPLLKTTFNVGIADIGTLIGLYFAPGIALAFLGGKIGQKFGDKPTTLVGLAFMLVGGLLMAISTSWSGQIIGRLVAGVGGVLLNIQMTKMVVDWFAGKEIATAMAIFVNSWPAGIAVSLLLLPAIGTSYGIATTYLAVVVLIGLGFLLMAVFYKDPALDSGPASTAAPLGSRVIIAVISAGLIWGLFNVGFAMIFSFGPTMLVERGWSVTSAGSAISLVLWTSVLSIPLGGFLADRTKKPVLIMIIGWTVAAFLLIALTHGTEVIVTLISVGIFAGIPAGSIMSLPSKVLVPETRAIGMGTFYTAYYAAMMVGPAIGGAFAKYGGHASAALDFGAAMFLLCLPILWFYLQRTRQQDTARTV
jgi:MFS family permease